MSDDLVERIRAKLRQVKQGPKPVEEAPVAPEQTAFLTPSWEPGPESMLARSYAEDPEGARVTRHNYAVYEIWGKIPCAVCGGSVTAGWGVMPDEPLDPRKPPRLCYGCQLRSNQTPEPVMDDLDGVVYECDIG